MTRWLALTLALQTLSCVDRHAFDIPSLPGDYVVVDSDDPALLGAAVRFDEDASGRRMTVTYARDGTDHTVLYAVTEL